MGEVNLPCFFNSLPEAIFVFIQLVGPFNEKNCDLAYGNAALALPPRPAFSSLRSQFFTIRTDPEPFRPAVNWLTSGFA